MPVVLVYDVVSSLLAGFDVVRFIVQFVVIILVVLLVVVVVVLLVVVVVVLLVVVVVTHKMCWFD